MGANWPFGTGRIRYRSFAEAADFSQVNSFAAPRHCSSGNDISPDTVTSLPTPSTL